MMETLTKSGPKRNRYIVIEGAIGVGKTTLARMLRDYYRTGMQLEVFEENPFLADFTGIGNGMLSRRRCSFC